MEAFGEGFEAFDVVVPTKTPLPTKPPTPEPAVSGSEHVQESEGEGRSDLIVAFFCFLAFYALSQFLSLLLVAAR
jgi:hypothetical protein